MRRFRKKVRRFVRLYWFWVSLGLVLTKVSVEAAYIERGYKAYGGEWLVLPVVLIVGYFVNEARMYLPDFIEEWREEKAYERRVAENRRRVPKAERGLFRHGRDEDFREHAGVVKASHLDGAVCTKCALRKAGDVV